jgi:AraC-like DNA-binding protein
MQGKLQIIYSINLFKDEKPYLDCELTLGRLAETLNVSPHNLSEVINTKLKQNFYDLVNSYRVEEVKRKLQSPEFDMYSILGIAYESGFNSKTSFNTIFKKYVGQTPSAYKKMNAKK